VVAGDNPSSFLSFTKTATADAPFRLTAENIPFYDLNIHCLTHDFYYGDKAIQEADQYVGDVSFFRHADLSDIWFKNQNAGSNTKVVGVATVPTTFVKQALGLI
jgi:hypothetical protein